MRWTPYDRKGLGYGQTDNPTWPGNKTGSNFPYDNSDNQKEFNEEVDELEGEGVDEETLSAVNSKIDNPSKRSNWIRPDRGSFAKLSSLTNSIKDAYYRTNKVINEMLLFELENLKMGPHVYPANPIKLKRAVVGDRRAFSAPAGDLNEPEIDPDDLIFTLKDLINSSDEEEDFEVY